jgi:acyl-CoA-binding protein
MFDLTGKAKWDAWNSRKGIKIYFKIMYKLKFLGMSQEDAKAEYVKAVKAIASRLGHNDVAERL